MRHTEPQPLNVAIMTGYKAPAFWLQVRENYIIDNFDAMVDYLYGYRYSPDELLPEELDATLRCLESLLLGLNDKISASSFYEPFSFDLFPGKDLDLARLSALYEVGILGLHKFGRSPHRLIIGFINLIFRSGKTFRNEVVKKLWDIAVAAVRGYEFVNLGLSWNDIKSRNMSNFCIMIEKCAAHVSFRVPASGECMKYYENEGFVCFGNETVVSDVNLDTYLRSETSDLVNLVGLLKVRVKREDRLRHNTFDELVQSSKALFNNLHGFRPTPGRNEKEYADGDEIFVRVTAVDGWRIMAITVDPEYKRVASTVFTGYKFDRVPEVRHLMRILRPGDILKVKYHPDVSMKFNLGEITSAYYCTEAMELAARKMPCIYVGEYPAGTQWITYGGFILSIDNQYLEKCNDDVRDAVDIAISEDKPLMLNVYYKVNNPSAIYANVDMSGGECKHFTEVDACENFYDDFLYWCDRECPGYGVDIRDYEMLDSRDVLTPLVNALCYIIENTRMSAGEKYEYAVAAELLSNMCGLTLNTEYLRLCRQYQSRLLDFSCNREVRSLPLPEALKENADAMAWSEIVGHLAQYKVNEIEVESEGRMPLGDKVAKLVEAANNLNGTISLSEQNNIKLVIAQTLRVEDEFIPLNTEAENFGIESQVLEFKQSIVFPPKSHRQFAGSAADPEIQKWAILKAVCGFMNSKFGGELLLGVNDKGFATGVDSDFDELYKRGLIKAPNLDNYSRYVTDEIKKAFCEYDSDRSASDIHFNNVSYSQEQTESGKYIIRITVRPNPRKPVRFREEKRPAGIEESYVRLNCETIVLTAEKKDIVAAEKLRR